MSYDYQTNKYILDYDGGTIFTKPSLNTDIPRYQDVKTYASIAGYTPGQNVIFEQNTEFTPFLLDSNNALKIKTDLRYNENLKLYLRYFAVGKSVGGNSLNFDVNLLYYDNDLNLIESSISRNLTNAEDELDFELIADAFNCPSNASYVCLGIRNNSTFDLRITYQYGNLNQVLTEKINGENPDVNEQLFILLGGLVGVPVSDLSFYVKKAGDTMSGTLNMNTNKILGVLEPDTIDGATNKGYVDGLYQLLINNLLSLNGSSPMTGTLNMNTNKIINVVDGSNDKDAINKSQLDTKLNLTGGTLTGDINMSKREINNIRQLTFQPLTAGSYMNINFTSADGGRGKLFFDGMCRMEISSANPEFTRLQLFQKLQMDDKIYFSSPHKIENMAAGTVSGDAVNKGQLDTKLNLSGGTLTGDINMDGNNLINCDVIRPQGISLHLLSRNQAAGIRVFDTLVDILSNVRMNGNKITVLGDGVNDGDAVNLKQLKEFKKQAFNLTGSSSNEGIGTHTFILPETVTTNTNFLISINLKMDFTGTFSSSNQIGATLRQLQDNDALITSTTDNFYVNINDLGSFKFINGISKTIITALPNTKKIEIDLVDNYTSGTSKTFNHMLEIEKL